MKKADTGGAGGAGSGAFGGDPEKVVDKKVKDYLERAKKILETFIDFESDNSLVDNWRHDRSQDVIEIAKMIQTEEHKQ